jgi:hypothetical protein
VTTFRKYGFTVITMAAVATVVLVVTGLGSAVTSTLAAQPPSPVNVVNDAAHAVPVKEQAVDANGNLKVHEQGTVPVTVQNAPAAQRPFQAQLGCEFRGSSFCETDIDPPSGTMLVVQTVSADVITDPSSLNMVYLLLEATGGETGTGPANSGPFMTAYFKPREFTIPGVTTDWVVDAQNATLYEQSGSTNTQLSVRIQLDGVSSGGGGYVWVSGYLIPSP